jgi:DNA-binding response OmpR family regulator
MTGSPSVLVVDDEPDVRWALEMILTRNGLSVTTAASGHAALLWLRQQHCDVILLDAKLGDADGVELVKKIRSQTPCTAPVILVSGYFYRDDSRVQMNLSAGVIAGFVTKPFKHDEILRAIKAVAMSGAAASTGVSSP